MWSSSPRLAHHTQRFFYIRYCYHVSNGCQMNTRCMVWQDLHHDKGHAQASRCYRYTSLPATVTWVKSYIFLLFPSSIVQLYKKKIVAKWSKMLNVHVHVSGTKKKKLWKANMAYFKYRVRDWSNTATEWDCGQRRARSGSGGFHQAAK